MATRLSWASVRQSPKTNFDVGLGYQLDNFEGATTSHARRAMPGLSRILHGPTLDASYRVHGSKQWRHWLGGRVEIPLRRVAGRTHGGVGGSVRMTSELFRTTRTSHSIGSMGIGTYVEAGARRIPGGTQVLTIGGGLNVRLPLAAF